MTALCRTARNTSQRTQLRAVCPEFDEACTVYDGAVARGHDGEIAAAWRDMQRIARVFWAGAEFGQASAARGIRTWRAEGA